MATSRNKRIPNTNRNTIRVYDAAHAHDLNVQKKKSNKFFFVDINLNGLFALLSSLIAVVVH